MYGRRHIVPPAIVVFPGKNRYNNIHMNKLKVA